MIYMTDVQQVWVDNTRQFGPRELACRSYNRAFPDRPPLVFGGDSGMVTGTWMIGACYKNPNPLYGAYPRGYLGRVHAMFPSAKRILHAFSGGLCGQTAEEPAVVAAMRAFPESDVVGPEEVELVDMHGPESGRYPTWKGDILDYPAAALSTKGFEPFDLILADPPYSADDAAKYDCPPVNRGKVIHALREIAAKGANLVWLDQVWPMHRKTDWQTWGTIGLIRSTNHRVRMVTIFEAV